MLAKYLLKHEKIDGEDFEKLMKKPVIWSESESEVELPDLNDDSADEKSEADPRPQVDIQPEVTAEPPADAENPGGIIE